MAASSAGAELTDGCVELGLVFHLGVAWSGQVDDSFGRDPSGSGRHDHHPIGQDRGLGDRVGDEDDRGVAALPQIEQQVAHVGPGDLVERCERLVHQQYRRAERERSDERSALLHPAREFVWVGLFEACQADGAEKFSDVRVVHHLMHLGAAVQRGEEPDVLGEGLPRNERRRLGHEPELLAGTRRVGARSTDGDRAAVGGMQTADDP